MKSVNNYEQMPINWGIIELLDSARNPLCWSIKPLFWTGYRRVAGRPAVSNSDGRPLISGGQDGGRPWKPLQSMGCAPPFPRALEAAHHP